MSNSRKEQLKALFEGNVAASPVAGSAARSGAVKAVGLSLERLEEKAGQRDRIVSLDPSLIDASFVSDRLSEGAAGDETFAALIASIRDGGQQVPVLVRPHPNNKERYQAAYGHRRILACREIGLPVNAIVRDLSDSELVLAQGRENALRRDLSFIEKARFSASLLEQGFDRPAIVQALAIHKADLSRALAIADAVPSWVAQAIGPAPKAGRARWMKLAERLGDALRQQAARQFIDTDAFRAMDSDARFAAVFSSVAEKKPSAQRQVLSDVRGRDVAVLTGRTLTLSKDAPPSLLAAIRQAIETHSGD